MVTQQYRRIMYRRRLGDPKWLVKHQQCIAATERKFQIEVNRENGFPTDAWPYFLELQKRHVLPLLRS